MMNADGQTLLALGLGVLLLTFATETAWRRGWLPQWLSRKILHVGAVGACALAPLWLQDWTLLRWVVPAVEPTLIYLVVSRRLFTAVDGRRSWGIIWFPLAYFILLFSSDKYFVVVSMAILAISDAAAAIVGQLFARHYFQLTGDKKSLPGSVAFLLSALLIIWASQYICPEHWAFYTGVSNNLRVNLTDHLYWTNIIFIVIILTALEALGSKGFDNFLVPLAAGAMLQHSWYSISAETAIQLWLGLAAALGFMWITVRRRSLSLDGAVAAAVMGLWVLFFGGLEQLWPLIFFFVSSTLIGRLTKGRAVISDAKHGQARDYRQVLCNGGIYALSTTVGISMIVSLAVSTADTWASEIGMYFRGRTYDIRRWRPSPVGLSGGVSWAGTLGGLAGALSISLFSFCLWRGMDLEIVLVTTTAGFLGMLLDSLLGATLQARYRDESTGELTDVPTKILQSGYRWMSNDAVNLLSNLLVVLLYLGYIIFMIYWRNIFI